MKQCLNCNAEIRGNYCAACGQKASTHRFSLKHIFSHDFIHGIFHLDKGILFTAKGLLLRPGHSIREYVAGKRVRHFNYFTMLLILIALSYYISGLARIHTSDIVSFEDNEMQEERVEFYRGKVKLISLLLIPVLSLVSLLMFRKSRQNYAEHLVLNAYRAAGEMLITIAFYYIPWIFITTVNTAVTVYYFFSASLPWVYFVWFYQQYFSPFYRNQWLLFLRVVLCMLIAYYVSFVVYELFFLNRDVIK
ncbi:DUF3667 domain-containing protein [Parapedobacter tibetensis]|uniref:DUF3667 domain-containing protein n=1 Tax=Parapedobacter tibetensis TaxID=2972951 RepID=UPI00214D53AC|nr:DUF3667 domain-containing protein [Parapedobacter tibetensis]